MSTVTRTIVFTDLANYTAQVARSDREGVRRLLEEHEALVTPIVERNGGRVVKNLGDSFMCLFGSATDGLQAALDVQRIVHAQGGISIRLAMTTGDVEEIAGDAFGDSVNLAARILSRTPAGEIWFGKGTQVCMNESEIPWEEVGMLTLKGVPGEQQAFRAIPEHCCWLPDRIKDAAKAGSLVRLHEGSRPPMLPPDPVILLEGFEPGSKELQRTIGMLPVLDPACLWLSAYNIAPSDRQAWTSAGRRLVIGKPEALEEAIEQTRQATARNSGSDTIVFEMDNAADLDLVICGLALPSVPLSEVVSSYSYDLLPDCRWVNRSDRSVVRVLVTAEGVRLTALAPGVSADGRGLASGSAIMLRDRISVSTPAGTLQFRETGQGYAGVVIADTSMRLSVKTGVTAELGREPNHPGLAFPDRRGQDNIQWCSGARAARARAGGFTLDRALAGRRQAAVQMMGGGVQVSPLHARCSTFVLRQAASHMERADSLVHVELGDMIIAGTTVVGLRPPS